MSAAIQLLEEDLRAATEEKNFYEAYQLYLSISQRLIKQKKQDEALEKLIQGTEMLNDIENKQYKMAVDLGHKFLQYLPLTITPPAAAAPVASSSNSTVTETSLDVKKDDNKALERENKPRDYSIRLIRALAKGNGLLQNTGKDIIKKLLAASKDWNKHSKEDSCLHEEIGKLYIESQDYLSGCYHFVQSSLPSSLELQLSLFNSLCGVQYEYFAAQLPLLTSCIIQYLSLKKHQEAHELLTKALLNYKEKHSDGVHTKSLYFKPSFKENKDEECIISVFENPDMVVLNFLQCLVFVLSKNSRPHYLKLKNQYKTLLSLPPSTGTSSSAPEISSSSSGVWNAELQYQLDTLEITYFGSTQGSSAQQSLAGSVQQNVSGMLNNVFRGLLSGFGSGASTTPTTTTTPSSTSTSNLRTASASVVISTTSPVTVSTTTTTTPATNASNTSTSTPTTASLASNSVPRADPPSRDASAPDLD